LSALVLLCLLVVANGGRAEDASPATSERSLATAFAADPLAEAGRDDSDRDPLEGLNRAVFGLNRQVDRWLMRPIARAYGAAVPDPARRAVRRVFDHFREPVVFVNDLLQAQPVSAARTLARFTVNTTLGVVGILDPATALGLPGHANDFGRTLAVAGLGSGPYLVLPLFGPTTLRGAVGSAVDRLFLVQTYVLGPGGLTLLGTSEGIAAREAHGEALDELERSSLDFYSALRSIRLQREDANAFASVASGS
jgi:phospholipid-binding lipoprotein MlaA